MLGSHKIYLHIRFCVKKLTMTSFYLTMITRFALERKKNIPPLSLYCFWVNLGTESATHSPNVKGELFIVFYCHFCSNSLLPFIPFVSSPSPSTVLIFISYLLVRPGMRASFQNKHLYNSNFASSEFQR